MARAIVTRLLIAVGAVIVGLGGSAVVSGAPATVGEAPAVAPKGMDVREPAWAPGDTRLAVGVDSRDSDEMSLYEVRIGKRAVRLHRLTGGSRRQFNPVWSPDGLLIAYGQSNDSGKGDLYVMRSDGSEKQKLEADVREPAWSPSGRSIVGWFERYGGPTRFAFVNVRGGGTRFIRLRRNRYVRWPFWSPDGNQIAFKANGGNGPTYQLDARGGIPRVLSSGVLAAGVWSHDWKHVAYEGRNGCLYVARFPRGHSPPVRLTSHGATFLDAEPAWSWDDRWLAFTRSRRGGHASLWAVRADGRGLREIVRAGP